VIRVDSRIAAAIKAAPTRIGIVFVAGRSGVPVRYP